MQDAILNICSFISVFCMTYAICFNMVVKDMTLPEAFFVDPIGYAVTIIPFFVPILAALRSKMRHGYGGRRTIVWLVEPILYIVFTVLYLLVIHDMSMTVRFRIDMSMVWPFTLGFAILSVLAVIQAGIFSFLENKVFSEVFWHRSFWIMYAVLCLVNGLTEAKFQRSLPTIPAEEILFAWISMGTICTLGFAFFIFIYMVIAIPAKLLLMLMGRG